MTAFSSRRVGYKIGAILLMLSFAVFVIGYSTPYWSYGEFQIISTVREMTAGQVSYSYSRGLWLLCQTARAYTISTYSCSSTGVLGVAGWLHAVRVLECVCLLGLGVAILYTIAVNCCRTVPGPRSRFIEAVALVSGVSGLAGAVLYIIFFVNDNSDNDKDTDSVISFLGRLSWTVSWSAYVAAVGAVLALLAALAVGIFNNPISDNYTSNTLGMTMVTTMTGYPVVLQGGHLSVPSVQGGNPYIYHSAQEAPSVQGAISSGFGAQGASACSKDGMAPPGYSNTHYTHPHQYPLQA